MSDAAVFAPPMKFGTVEVLAVENLLASEDWVAQQKMDGTFGRAVLRHGEDPLMTRDGSVPLKHTAATQHLPGIWDALKHMQGRLTVPGDMIVLEGEIMLHTGEYRVFEMIHARWHGVQFVTADDPWWRRSFALDSMQTLLVPPLVTIIQTARSAASKRALLDGCRDGGKEGVVFKRRDHGYQPGSRTKDVLKFKFVKTADVVVTEVNRPDPKHGSFSFGVYHDGVLIPLGSCSAIGKPLAEVGDVIEVAYLFRDPTGGGLVQPRMTRVRTDKPAEECGFDQFQTYTRDAV